MKKLLDRFSSLTVKQKVQTIFMIALMIFIGTVIIFFCYIIKNQIADFQSDHNHNKLISAEKGIDAVTDSMDNMSKVIMGYGSVLPYLRYERGVNSAEVESDLRIIQNSFPRYHSIYIFRLDFDNRIKLSDPAKIQIGVNSAHYEGINKDWREKVQNRSGGYVITPNNRNQFSGDSPNNNIMFMRAINDLNTQTPMGMLTISCSENFFRQAYSQYSDESTNYAIIDQYGNSISADIEKELLERILEIDGILKSDEDDSENAAEKEDPIKEDSIREYRMSKYVISVKEIKNSDMFLICCSKYNTFSGISGEMPLIAVFFLITIFLTMIIINIYLNKYITTPLTRLSDSMNITDDGYPLSVSIDTYDDEIGRLKDCYNDMVVKVNRLIVEVVDKEKQRQQAEMNVIQEQIKPHFLYNTLETIGCMALQNSREEVYDTIETLGNFYRNFLSKGSENITIAQEVAIVRDYMKLLKIRYDDMFDDEYEIQEDLNYLIVLKLILQPLVENSIYHGIRPKGEHGLIRISIFSSDQKVHFKVYDTGVGMTKYQIERLLNGKDSRSFGFQATINRIKNFYQVDDVVRIRSVEGEFCEIEIIIPFENMR